MKFLQLISTALPRSSKSTLTSPRFTAQLVAGIVALNLIVTMLVTLTLYEGRKKNENQAVVTTQNLSHVLEHDLVASLDKIDLTLLTVVDEAVRLRRSGSLDSSVLNAFIERQTSRLPELSGLRLTDAQGDLRYGTTLAPGATVNVASRDFFHPPARPS